jgi:hypothetical protein
LLNVPAAFRIDHQSLPRRPEQLLMFSPVVDGERKLARSSSGHADRQRSKSFREPKDLLGPDTTIRKFLDQGP